MTESTRAAKPPVAAEVSATDASTTRSRAERSGDEARLVEAALDGDVRAFERLVDLHQSRVLRVLRLMGVPGQDREDVSQDVFIRVFRHLRGFHRGRSFGSWIYRIAVNAAHDYRTRAGRRPELSGVAPEEEEDGSLSAEAGIDLRRRLLTALELLSDRERAVFVLQEVEGLATREVAATLGITRVTVRRHLGRARRRLQGALSDRP